MNIEFENIRQSEGIVDEMFEVKNLIEDKINLRISNDDARRITINTNKIMRICLIVGLSLSSGRDMDRIREVQLSTNRFYASFYRTFNLKPLYDAMLKLRYRGLDIDWNDITLVSKIFNFEILMGRNYLLEEGNLNSILFSQSSGKALSQSIPMLDLIIGNYGKEDMEAVLKINDTNIANSQILIAGATGSGKTNLLAVLIQQFRALSCETAHPVNFLLFDYKGEFSDVANSRWLTYFDVDRTAILDPITKPLPFNPFKDFRGKPINEINLYSTEMANALGSLDRTSISANMSNRLSEAIVNAYKKTAGAPISFEMMLREYQAQMRDADNDDSISSILKQLVRNNIFEKEDKVNLVKECFIVKMNSFPKDGPIAKAIVYFIISKLNNIYENLDQQAKNDEAVEIRHFTIIDEAHYMLDFDNRPLRNLIAVGRNKGLSIILATQDMSSFKSRYFNYYANAQYPLIMKQQTIDDGVIRDLFGVSGRELQEVRSEISGLQKGELIIKDQNAFILEIGKKYKKIKVNKLI